MSGVINWLSQLASVTKFGVLTIPQRRGAVAAAMFGIAGVVAVLVGVLSIAQGFRRAMTVSATPDTALVLRSGSDSELVSGLGREETPGYCGCPRPGTVPRWPSGLGRIICHH